MAMTVTEATALNQLLDWLFKTTKDLRGRAITDNEAKEAAKVLAASSYKKIMAGISPEDVEKRWRNRRKK